MVKPGKHPADFAVFPFGQNDLKNRGVAALVDNSGATCSHLALSQPDTVRQLLNDVVPGIAGDGHSIGLLHTIFGMCQALGQCAIICQKHQAFAVAVEPAYNEDPFLGLGDQILNQGPARWVAGGADIALGLVNQVIGALLRLNLLSVDSDSHQLWINLGSQFIGDNAVDGHTPLKHEQFASSARSNTSLRHDLLKTLWPVHDGGRFQS